MTDQPFEEPRHIKLNRIYTRGGDEGQTSLVGGQRVPKDALRIECYGTVDELNAFVGMAQLSAREHRTLEPLARILTRVQHELFNLGSVLATMPDDVHPRQPRVTAADTARLEGEIDRMNAELPPLNSFVLPGGSRLNTELHACRTICRRAERRVVELARTGGADAEAVAYLNRLSDAFFVWSRWANRRLALPENLWRANQPSEEP